MPGFELLQLSYDALGASSDAVLKRVRCPSSEELVCYSQLFCLYCFLEPAQCAFIVASRARDAMK
jgi:hypothetical protein